MDYTVEKFDENSEVAGFSITYIGDEQMPEEIYYSFDYPSLLGLKIDGNSTFEGELELAGHNCDDCTGAEEDDEITVIIKWNEKSETLKLKNQ